MISIVVPNFNGAKLLAKNLPRLIGLLEKSKLEYEVIVVDDASSDDSVAKVKKQKLKVKIIEKERNEGFASTADDGIRKARGEIVFTIKTDALPETASYFKLMLGHFRDPKVFAVSAALKTIEKGKEEIRGQGVLTFFRGFFLHFRTYSDYVSWLQTMRTTRGSILNSKFEIRNSKFSMWADGSAMAVRKKLYLKIGGFDRLYNPFYWEDVDLGYRAWKAGYRIDFEPRAVLLHNYESGSIAQHYTKEQIKLISLRNQFIFARKNADLKHRILYLLWKPYHDLVAIKNQDWVFFAAWWQSEWSLLRILVARIRQSKVNKLSDDEVLGMVG